MVSLLALTSSTLIASAVILTNLTLNTVIEGKVKDLNYHLIIFVYGGYDVYSRGGLINSLNKIYAENFLIDSFIIIPVELVSTSNTDVKVNGLSIEIANICLLHIPILNDTLVYSTHRSLMNFGKYTSIKEPFINLTIGNRTYGPFLFVKKLDDVTRSLSNTYRKYVGSEVDFIQDQYNPLTIVFNTIYIKTPYRNESIFVLTGSSELYLRIAETLEAIGAKPISIPLTDVYYENYVAKRTEVNTPGRIVFSIINLNPKRVAEGFGADYSFSKVYGLIKYVNNAVHPFRVGVLDDRVLIELINVRRGDYQFRNSVGIAVIPVLFISFIMFVKIPSILLSLCRREIALLKVRGVSSKILYRSFILNMIIWIIIGSSFSILLAPLVVSFINYGSIPIVQYAKLLNIILNPHYIAVSIAITLALSIGSFIKSYIEIQSIESQEFFKPYFTTKAFIGGEKVSGLYVILLVFSIYVVVRMLILNPYRILVSYEESPLASFISVILLILEPITLLFGSVILVYTIVKTLTIFPGLTGRIVSLISKLFTRKYSPLITRLLYLKYVYVALALIVGNFSLSLLASGVMSLDLTNDLYTRVGYAMHGDLGYILIKPIVVKNVERIYSELDRIDVILSGKGFRYSLGFIFLGFVDQGWLTNCFNVIPITEKNISIHICKAVWIEIANKKIPISYVVFVDDNVNDVAKVIDELSYVSSMKRSLDELSSGGKAIYIFNRRCEEELRRSIYDYNEPYIGVAKLNVAGVKSLDINVIDSARNIPFINALVDAGARFIPHFVTTLEYSGLSTLPVVAPYERGLIMNLKDLHAFEGYGLFGYIFILVPKNAYVEVEGYDRYPVSRTERFIEDTLGLMNLSHKFTLIMGLCMLTSCIIVASALSYIIVTENMKIFVVMSGRGVSVKDIYVATVAEVVSITLLYLIPGVIAGLIIGYGLSLVTTQSFELTQVVPIYIDEAYGTTPRLIMSKTLALSLISSIAVSLSVAFMVIKLLWKKVLTQTLRIIGGF